MPKIFSHSLIGCSSFWKFQYLVDLLNYFTDKIREYGTGEDFDVAELMKFTEEEIQKLDDEMKKPCGSGHEGEGLMKRIRNLLESIVMGCRSGFKCAVCNETVIPSDEVMLCYCPYGPQITHCLNKVCLWNVQFFQALEDVNIHYKTELLNSELRCQFIR